MLQELPFVERCLAFDQLQDAARGKLSKCEHIDIDWGVTVTEQEEDIYQTPGDVQSGGGGIRRSETADNLISANSSGVAVPGRVSKPYQKAASSPILEPRRWVNQLSVEWRKVELV